MNLKTLLTRQSVIVADGATGTYFSALSGQNVRFCEKANLSDPETIRKIYSNYLQAGASLLRTNTFSANSFSLGVSHDELALILRSGYELACSCAGEKAVVCADVSAVYDTSLSQDMIEEEYRFLIDTFLSCGAETFLFETLPDLNTVLPAIDYLLSQRPTAEVITSFTVLPDRHTRSGLSLDSLLTQIEENKEKLLMTGLNCGCGATQLFKSSLPFFSYIQENTDLYTMILPNAGYPTVENGRTVFTSSPEYFAQQTAQFAAYGIRVLGGCCGTEPAHIRCLSGILRQSPPLRQKTITYQKPVSAKADFATQLTENKFLIAAELDPPNTSDLSKLIAAAKELKEAGTDIITISDSPLGHARMDSILCSAKIRREAGIETLPHLCCRDKNLNALRSSLLGAHSEGIRAVLAVTGDHIAETDRTIVKPVFNVDSTRLMQLINSLNEDIFRDSPIAIGGAFDPAPKKRSYSLSRLDKKCHNGLRFVLTQPVFSQDAIPSLDEARQKGAKVLVGLMPIVSYRNACFMKNEVPGMTIPDELVARFDPDMTKEEAVAVGISITCELASLLRPHADGFYFITPFNRASVISTILHKIR